MDRLRDNKSKMHKALIVFENVYKFSNKDLYTLRQENQDIEDIFDLLPKYCINANGDIKYAKYYLQFWGHAQDDYQNEEFYFFDVYTTDKMLQHEIDESSVDDFFSDLAYDFDELFDKFYHYTLEDWKWHKIPPTEHAILKYYWTPTYYGIDGMEPGELVLKGINYLNLEDEDI